MKKNIKKGGSLGKKVAIGGAIAAIGAGAYYLLGPKAKEHQKKANILMGKIKDEVEKEIKKAGEVSAPIYQKVVDTVSENYVKQYKVHEKDIKAFAKKLKSEWNKIK